MDQDAFVKCRVLLLGGKKHGMNTLKSVLGIAGVTNIFHVEDSQRAMDLLTQENFDAVFCDAGTEPLSGKCFPAAARANTAVLNPLIPIFELHDRASLSDVARARDSGVTDIMTYPISPKTIFTKLGAALATPRPFIAAPNFFGPDRRAPRENFGGRDRRVREPVKASVDPKSDTTAV
jgi:two-component system chemotaxis response regulator CheY